jgi:hypothetical protein
MKTVLLFLLGWIALSIPVCLFTAAFIGAGARRQVEESKP